MLLWRRPDDAYLRGFLVEQKEKPLSYGAFGSATFGKRSKEDCKELLTAGYDVDHSRVKLGEGEAVYQAGVKALKEWRMHRFGSWVELLFPDVPIAVGETVGILANHAACYTLNGCKIVYVVDEAEEDGTCLRFGFAYGTTETHAESGEERFLIEWSRADNSVHYDILSFSRPSSWFVKLGYPFARFVQSSFIRESQKSMIAAVSGTAL